MKNFTKITLFSLIVIFVAAIGGVQKSSAINNTYYLAVTGNDTNSGSFNAPFATFRRAFEVMSPGDTLIVKNGIYYQTLRNPPSGTIAQYTTIKAENDWRVIIDGSTLGPYDSPLRLDAKNYIQIEGLKFKGGKIDGTYAGAGEILSSSYVKIKRCAFYDVGSRSPDDTGNISTLSIDQSHHLLLEDCYAFGGGRYKVDVHESNRVILRRFVMRHDRMDSRFPQALIAIYRSSYTQLQNVIAIDSDQRQFYRGYSGFYGAIYSPNSDTTYSNTGLKILGSIVLNVDGETVDVPFTLGDHLIKDSVFWHNKSGSGWSYPTGANVTVDHVTIGDTYGPRVGDIEPNSGVALSGFGQNTNVTNSVIYRSNLKGIWNFGVSDYNDLYSNGQNYGSGWLNGSEQTPTRQGAHDRFVDPGFRYITRIESNSALKNAASDGGDIGANVLKRYGVSGTLWGEPGFETLTNENLWPWPYENEIGADMRAYNVGPSGDRGFARSNTTLTRYIWEYLGNSCPADVCTTSSPNSGSTGSTTPQPPAPTPPPSPTPPPTQPTTPPSATGSTYYVSASGSDFNPGTENQPWRTLQRAADTAIAGDLVLVNDGFYAGFRSVNSGTANNPITFRARGSNAVINSRNSMTADNINIENNDYITVSGFKVMNSARDGIRIAVARNVTVSNNTISGSRRFGILTGFAPAIQLINNDVSNSSEHGIYVSNSNSSNDNPVLRNNRSYNNGQNGIQLNGDPNAGGDGLLTGAVIEKNVIRDNQLKGLSIISSSDSIIRNNIIYNNGIQAGAGGIHIVEEIGTAVHSNNNTIVNNTIVESRIAAIRINANNINNVVFNNIAIGRYSVALEGSGNFMDSASNFQSTSTTELFVNQGLADFHLLNGASVINAGKAAFGEKNAPSDDFDGNTRPQGAGFDIGAYEFVVNSVTGTTTPPATPPTIPPTYGPVLLHPSGTLVKTNTNDNIYIVDGTFKRLIPNRWVFNSQFPRSKIIVITDTEMNVYDNGTIYPFRDGELTKEQGSSIIYVFENSQKRPFLNTAVFIGMGYRFSSVITVPAGTLNIFPSGPALNAVTALHPNGTLIKTALNRSVYIVDNSQKRFISQPIFSNSNFITRKIVTISEAEMNLYALGRPLPFRNGEIVRERSSTQLYIFENGQKLPLSQSTFNLFNYRNSRIVTVPVGILNQFPTGLTFTPTYR